jgi:hypothetical protein
MVQYKDYWRNDWKDFYYQTYNKEIAYERLEELKKGKEYKKVVKIIHEE